MRVKDIMLLLFTAMIIILAVFTTDAGRLFAECSVDANTLLLNRPHFSMVCTLIDRKNDVMFKTQVELRAASLMPP